MLKIITTRLTSGLLLVTVLVACTSVGQPVATQSPGEPTILPKPASTPVPYLEPGGSYPDPSSQLPYPPADQSVGSPAYPDPMQPYPAPWQPQAADQSLQRAEAFVDEMDILVMESFPPQYLLNLQGALPTPCHQLRVMVAPPDSLKDIHVSVYSVVDPNEICVQVLAPFEAAVPLQGQPTGRYMVLVNGKQAGVIEVP